MKIMRFLCLVSLIVFGAFDVKPSYAETTEEMLSNCRPFTQASVADGKVELETDYNTGVCWSAFSVVQALLSSRNSETRKPMLWACAPAASTRTQLISVFVHYAESHPEKYSDVFFAERRRCDAASISLQGEELIDPHEGTEMPKIEYTKNQYIRRLGSEKRLEKRLGSDEITNEPTEAEIPGLFRLTPIFPIF